MAYEDPFGPIVETLLSCACVALTGAGHPACSCCLDLAPATECCSSCDSGNGSLVIRPIQIGPSRSFPTILAADGDNRCPPNLLVLQASIEIQRCVPVISETGASPSCDESTAATLDWLTDAAIIRQALGCCLLDLAASRTLARWSLGVSVPTEPLGGCAGSALTVWIGVPNCVCPG